VAVASGANMNFDRLRFVAERAELGEQREAVLAVTIPEKPGSFRKFINVLGKRNITEFNYRYADAERAHIFVGVSVHNRSEAGRLVEMLERHDLPASTSPTMSWPRCTSATWSAAAHRRPKTKSSTASCSPSARARWRISSPSCARTGTSRCSTIAITVRTLAVCWSACRCPADDGGLRGLPATPRL
jgi:hypothetical protein